MKEGKLPIHQLKDLIILKGCKKKGIIASGEVGSDVAIIDINSAKKDVQNFYENYSEVLLVEKSDPITFPTSHPGRYVVIINANDISCSGALPFGILLTIICPPNIKYKEIEKIQLQAHQQCKELGIAILGGHTEISQNVRQTLVSGHMFGFVPKDLVVPNILSVGEKIVVIGNAGIEGTGIIISEAGKYINTVLSKSEVIEGKRIGEQLRVVDIALDINKRFKPSLLHDATEGGIYGALTELVVYSSVGIEINTEPPLSPITKKLSIWLQFDPYRLISSGALIVSINSKKSPELVKYLQTLRIPCKVIGTVTKNKGVVNFGDSVIESPKGDEIITALQNLEEKKNACDD